MNEKAILAMTNSLFITRLHLGIAAKRWEPHRVEKTIDFG